VTLPGVYNYFVRKEPPETSTISRYVVWFEEFLFLDCTLRKYYFYLDEFDSYIIVSFVNATLVLSIGETVEEVTDSGFLGTTPTLSCTLLGENALVQVNWCLVSLYRTWLENVHLKFFRWFLILIFITVFWC